ncbi:MAG: serine/threonine-protein kinase [Planctomycetota bacterium]
MTSPEQYQKAVELFEQCLAMPPEDRPAALDAACAGDDALRRDVEGMLAFAQADDTLDVPSSRSVLDAAIADARDDDGMPEVVGEYTVLRELGRGGMGVVYEAQQAEPRRSVALKVLPELGAARLGMRLRQEAHVLGQLSHPGIARIYDAGSATVHGRSMPYIAMELIDGGTLDAYADEHALSVLQRLELIARVADAVQAAHTRGIIHRDLKPHNVLVAGQAGDIGQPKILDFGVARLTNADLLVTSVRTETSQLVGTLQYMSPEQLAGDSRHVDARSDVYALGVIACELLTGTRPFELEGLSLLEAISRLRDSQPKRIASIDRSLSGDVALIIETAMAHAPDRRYATAAEFAAEIRRFLRNEPIFARPPSATYKLGRFVARNRTLVTAAGVALTLLIAGLIGTTYGLFEARRSEALAREAEADAETNAQTAEREAAKATAINDFLLQDLLEGIDPARNEDRDITMRAVLERAAERIEGRFDDQPDVEVGVRLTLGNMLEALGQHSSAEVQYRAVLALQEARLGPEADDTMLALNVLATCLMFQANFEEAMPLLLRQVEVLSATETQEGITLRLQALGNLGTAYLQTGRYDEAAPILEQTLEQKRAVLGDRDLSTLTSVLNLGGLYVALGRYDRGVELSREAYEGRIEALGAYDVRTMRALRNYTWALSTASRADEAKDIIGLGLAGAEQRLGPDHPTTVSLRTQLAGVHRELEEYEQAEAHYREIHQHYLQTNGEAHYMTLGAAYDLGTTLHYMDRHDEALVLLKQQVALEGGVRAGHSHYGLTLALYGICLSKTGQFEEAERALLDAVELLESTLGPGHRSTRTAIAQLVQHYDDCHAAEPERGCDAKAEAWRPRINPRQEPEANAST